MTGAAAAVVPMTAEQADAYTALAVFAYVGLALLLAAAVRRTVRQAQEQRRAVEPASPPPALLGAGELEASAARPPAGDPSDLRGLLLDRYL